jgi:hypothetical protein
MNLLITNYIVDIYAIGWCVFILIHALRMKKAAFLASWSVAQMFLFTIDFLDRFLNKGYCLLSSCEPTNTIKQFFNITMNGEGSTIVRFISMTLMFVAIIKMHKFIERHIKEENI